MLKNDGNRLLMNMVAEDNYISAIIYKFQNTDKVAVNYTVSKVEKEDYSKGKILRKVKN